MEQGFQNRLKNLLDDHLSDSVRHGGDGQRELHKCSMSIWDGLRSAILSIR
jgi:hypothetical protein